jgi:cytoskeletal protein RodZ
MIEIGQTLQQARVALDMSIQDVARETRVPRSSLEAIEAGDREILPAAVYVRGFVRSFAIAVSVDSEPLLERLSAADQAQETVVETSPSTPMPVMNVPEDTTGHYALLLSDGLSDSSRMRFGPAALVFVALAMFLTAWIMVGTRSTRGTQTAQPTTPVLHQNHSSGVSTTIGLDAR